jgi:hypothetical protein
MKSFGQRIAAFFRSLLPTRQGESGEGTVTRVVDITPDLVIVTGKQYPAEEPVAETPEFDFPELSMDNYQAGPHDHYINVTLIWDLDAYTVEMEQLVNAPAGLRGVMEMAQQFSESQTTFLNYELMPTEARLIKAGTPETIIAPRSKSASIADDLVEVLRLTLPPLLEGGEPEAYEFWWLAENGDREVRRYTP